MNLIILTPEHEIFNGAVKSVKVPAIGGQFEILNKHAPVVAALDKGKIKVTNTKSESTYYQIDEGYVEVLNNQVVILVSGTVQKQ
ncbi:MAG: ATP synthase F1 subunit epsilon [Saprospiraceae bacterium]|jgi:F-type H+-transporting ATPase subunit epsilon|nr:ATP synthase F1 subunit epsilon [Saprospiraceae bacterium]MBK6816580.1 ATP synthase F1 subunit epsilon [Saprospiraceae bacterium]MBK7371106.1 ATP synthase F1 subunit epsilon [Saprospiraceae bacterium]MBK7609454.1 ATP synthase F1 subunit epsilon [Saprospiraceae bacterium]MBK9679934.1 ATP synthase F1 subunit epsilon [Saprospiraceae bacterium]